MSASFAAAGSRIRGMVKAAKLADILKAVAAKGGGKTCTRGYFKRKIV